jgi:hypothetical protein
VFDSIKSLFGHVPPEVKLALVQGGFEEKDFTFCFGNYKAINGKELIQGHANTVKFLAAVLKTHGIKELAKIPKQR